MKYNERPRSRGQVRKRRVVMVRPRCGYRKLARDHGCWLALSSIMSLVAVMLLAGGAIYVMLVVR